MLIVLSIISIIFLRNFSNSCRGNSINTLVSFVHFAEVTQYKSIKSTTLFTDVIIDMFSVYKI